MKITRFALRSKMNLIIKSTDFITNKNWLQDWWYFESFHWGSFRGEQYGAFYCWVSTKHARLLLNFCHFFLAKSCKIPRFGPGDSLKNPTMGFSKCVVPENIHTPPPSHRRDLPYDPPSLWIFQNFCTPPGNIAISNWSEQRSSFVH